MRLSKRQRAKLHRLAYAAQQTGHKEICGLLALSDGEYLQLHPILNENTCSYKYQLSRSAIREAQRKLKGRGLEVIGSFHSHPLGYAVPSQGDFASAFYKKLELIYDVCAREIKVWRLVSRHKCRATEIEITSTKQPRCAK
jgi:proteasome lid subunit RPN8/RPN11